MSDELENAVPKLRDSDAIYLIVKRLEQAASMMMRYEYGDELDRLMDESGEMLGWLADHMAKRGRS